MAAGAKYRFLCAVTPVDQACIAHVGRVHGHTTRAAAIRFCLQKQRERSTAEGAARRHVDLAESVREIDHLGSAWRFVNRRMTRWHDSYRKADRDAMTVIMGVHNLRSQAEAVRLAIRAQALADGYDRDALMDAIKKDREE